MRNELAVVGIIVSFAVGFGIGMMLNGSGEYKGKTSPFSKFIGTWRAVEYNETINGSAEYTWCFYKNYSLYLHIDFYNSSGGRDNLTVWYIFEVYDDQIKLITKDNPSVHRYLGYEFSDNDKQLTLMSPTGKPLTLHKIE